MIKKTVLISLLCLTIIGSTGFVSGNADLFFQITKNLEIFGKLYRELMVSYVDEVDPSAVVKLGINSMLEGLDPYTVYYDDSNNELELLMSGSYGGIGITVMQRGNDVVISNLLDGYSAQKEGIRLGDVIVRVDSAEVNSIKELGKWVKGKPGTKVKVFIKRENVSDILEFNLTREKVELKNVPVFTTLSNNIGYIQLARFNKNAANEVKSALQKLKPEQLNGLILDLRGNPGGRLDEAVDICKKFLPKNSLIVSTKGRTDNSKQEYRSDESPMYPTGKIIVLIDSLSASASEIVAGALQDHDRATLVGVRSYGKGLVQTISPIAYNTSLKITTARYYTPSGRCIQIRDIKDKSLRISKSDSLSNKTFKTTGGRTVLEADGITPDIIVKETIVPEIIKELEYRGLFFEFSASYAMNHKLTTDFSVTPAIFKEFLQYVEKENFHQKLDAFELLDGLSKELKKDTEFASVVTKLEASKTDFKNGVFSDLKSHKDLISEKLKKEILSKQLSEEDVFKALSADDRYLKTATDYLTTLVKK